MEPNAVPHDSIIVDAQSALDILPKSGVAFACAYGSRYLEDAKKSQLDLLVVVDNAHLNEWHYENLHRNPKHYFLSSMPPVAYQLATRVRNRVKGPGTFGTSIANKMPVFSSVLTASAYAPWGILSYLRGSSAV